MSIDPTTPDAGRATDVLARFVADDGERRRKVRRQLLVLLGFTALAVVCIAGLVSGEVTRRLFAIVLLGVVGVLGAGGALVALVRLRNERRTGEDAIDLVVEDSGLVGPGGLAVPWSEVAGVEMSASGAVRILLTDPRSTLDRTTTPRQAAAVRTSVGAPHVLVELGARDADELAHLRAVLDAELAPRGQRVGEITG